MQGGKFNTGNTNFGSRSWLSRLVKAVPTPLQVTLCVVSGISFIGEYASVLKNLVS